MLLSPIYIQGSPYASQLQKDKETLLLQIHTLERNIELIRTENDHLKRELQGKVSTHNSDVYIIT